MLFPPVASYKLGISLSHGLWIRIRFLHFLGTGRVARSASKMVSCFSFQVLSWAYKLSSTDHPVVGPLMN